MEGFFSAFTPENVDKAFATSVMAGLTEFVGNIASVAGSLQGARNFSALSNRIDDIQTIKYNPRIRERALQAPLYHNFPYSFDKEILKTNPNILKDGSKFYQFPGSVNGKLGNYELIQNSKGVIYHRNFKPIKE